MNSFLIYDSIAISDTCNLINCLAVLGERPPLVSANRSANICNSFCSKSIPYSSARLSTISRYSSLSGTENVISKPKRSEREAEVYIVSLKWISFSVIRSDIFSFTK